mgnify:CR=1 FL=1|jgi:tRNA threonylcarbamoyladenosine biosynthesis protein TsaE
MTIESNSPEETEILGRELAKNLAAGDIVLLYGDLGAGKSVLARGIIRALPGGKNRTVRSPTYVYIQQHPTNPPVSHVDLYRLPKKSAPEDIGLEEWANSERLTIVEWAQRLAWMRFEKATEVHIEILGENRRRFLVQQYDSP